MNQAAGLTAWYVLFVMVLSPKIHYSNSRSPNYVTDRESIASLDAVFLYRII